MNNETSINMNLLMDVEMNVTVRFGSTRIPLRDVANFNIGTMIELNRSVDEPVELLVNNALFASGEVVVVDGYYGVRITKLHTPNDRADSVVFRNHPAASNTASPEVTQ